MIITTVSHGRTPRDTANLLRHLERQDGQRSRVVAVDWSPADDARGALRAMELLRDGSKAEIAFHHLTVNPRTRLTAEQRDVVVARITRALGAQEHARIVWEHDDKGRSGDGADHHFHLVLGHVGPTLRALDMGHSYARLEAVARGIEHDLGETMTPSRRGRSVAARLRQAGREDVAQAVETSAGTELPRSATSSRARARADRMGLRSPQEARQAVEAAWAASDTGQALKAALAASGLALEPGRKAGVWLVTQDGAPIGALDRLARVPGAAVEARMRQLEVERGVPADPVLRGRGAAVDLGGGPGAAGPAPSPGGRDQAPARSRPGPSDAGRGPVRDGGAPGPRGTPASRVPAGPRADEARTAPPAGADRVDHAAHRAGLTARLDAMEAEHRTALARLDAALPTEPARLIARRDRLQTAREAQGEAWTVYCAVRAMRGPGPRPTGLLALLRGQAKEHDRLVREAEANLAQAQTDWLAKGAATDSRRSDLQIDERMHAKAVAEVRAEQEPARTASEEALTWIEDARAVLAKGPDQAVQHGLRAAVEAMRAERERERSRSREGPFWSL